MVAVLLLALSAVQLAAGWSTATQQVAVGGPKIAFQEGSVTVSVPGPRPPVLFMLLTSKDGKEKIGVQVRAWIAAQPHSQTCVLLPPSVPQLPSGLRKLPCRCESRPLG